MKKGYSPLNADSERIVLLRLEEGQDPIRGQYHKRLVRITDFHASVTLRNTDRPDHYSDNVRYIYRVLLLPSDYYRPEIFKGRFFKYRNHEFLMIASVKYEKRTNFISCLCYDVNMADILEI